MKTFFLTITNTKKKLIESIKPFSSDDFTCMRPLIFIYVDIYINIMQFQQPYLFVETTITRHVYNGKYYKAHYKAARRIYFHDNAMTIIERANKPHEYNRIMIFSRALHKLRYS